MDSGASKLRGLRVRVLNNSDLKQAGVSSAYQPRALILPAATPSSPTSALCHLFSEARARNRLNSGLQNDMKELPESFRTAHPAGLRGFGGLRV